MPETYAVSNPVASSFSEIATAADARKVTYQLLVKVRIILMPCLPAVSITLSRRCKPCGPVFSAHSLLFHTLGGTMRGPFGDKGGSIYLVVSEARIQGPI